MIDRTPRVETEPSTRELDALIAVEFVWTAVGADPLNDTCRDPDGEWGELPFFTSSLDAKVPGEKIVFVSYNDGDGWSARNYEDKDIVYCGYHPTSEASARRAAAMKARARAKEKADG